MNNTIEWKISHCFECEALLQKTYYQCDTDTDELPPRYCNEGCFKAFHNMQSNKDHKGSLHIVENNKKSGN